MIKSTWKQFKEEVLTSKVQFLGAINKPIEEVITIIDNNLDSIEDNYNRVGNIKSNHIEFIYTIDEETHNSRLDTKGKVYKHNGCYIIQDWNCMVYRFK